MTLQCLDMELITNKMKKLFAILFIAFLSVIFVYTKFIEPEKLIVKHQTLYLPNWNNKLDGLKIAVLSDLHIYYGTTNIRKLNRIVELTNEQKPDIIFLLGDYEAKTIAKTEQRQKDAVEALKLLYAPFGVISVLGNHDYYPEGTVKELLQKADIKVLENKNTYIYFSGQEIKVTGLKDLWHCQGLDPKEIIGTTRKNTPIIVLAHNPDSFPEVPQNTSLTLSGHTHGGEVYLPIFGAPMVPSKYAQRYRKGYIVENNKHLYVTSGIGTLSGFRLFNPPEIVILTLQSQTQNNKITNTKSLTGFHRNYIPLFNKIVNRLKKIPLIEQAAGKSYEN